MSNKIPAALISICSEIISERETHDSLDSLFVYAGAYGDPPLGSKKTKALSWIRATNIENVDNPLLFLGLLIESYMEEPLDPNDQFDMEKLKQRNKIINALDQCNLRYIKGGKISGQISSPSHNLEKIIKGLDADSIENEFERALENVNENPREAISAASNILESLCKLYIADENLEMPSKQDLKSIWTIVRKHLGFDPQMIEENDLKQILSGLISITEGIGALRTHASSAHGAGKKIYKIEPRHARLAIHSAHTVCLFILETWKKRKEQSAQAL